MKNTTLYIVGGIVALSVILIVWGSFTGTPPMWGNTNIPCLQGGHQRLAMHFHPHVRVVVDGEEEIVPSNIGISDTCMAEVHTHDASGTLHIESASRGKTFTLEDFFAVWGETVEREDLSLGIEVNGTPIRKAPREVELRDNQQIILTYTRTATTTSE